MKKLNKKYNEQIKLVGNELFPVFAGLFFGYNLALIAGDTILNTYSELEHPMLSKSLLWGAFIGCILVYFLAWNLNKRKEFLILGVSISLVASLLGGITFLIIPIPPASLLPTIRFIMGITAGLSCVAPVYLVEESPEKKADRGNYFGRYQLSITIGIMLAYLIMVFFEMTEQDNNYYSATFFICTILSIMYLFTLKSAESKALEKWIKKHDDFRDKKEMLKKRCELAEKEEIEKIEKLLREPDIIKKTPWHKVYKLPIVTGIIIITIQQIVGINIVIFKVPELLYLFDINKSTISFFLLVIGFINVLSTIPGMLMIDRIGRRSLFLIGMVGMIFSLLLLTPIMLSIQPDYSMIPKKAHIMAANKFENSSSKIMIYTVVDSVISSRNSELYDINQLKKYFLNSDRDVHLHLKVKKYSEIHKKLDKFELATDVDTAFYTLIFKEGMLDKIKVKDREQDIIRFTSIFGDTDSGRSLGLIVFFSLIAIYIVFFASTLGILGWLVPAEILPIKIRIQGMAFVGATHWIINLIIIYLFSINIAGSFFFAFSILSMIALYYGFLYFPETRGKSLKKIDYYWRNRGNLEGFNDEEFYEKSNEVEEKVEEYMGNINNLYEKIKKTQEDRTKEENQTDQ